MNLTTLEQSKKLKKWGAPQDTEFEWAVFVGGIVDVPHLTLRGEYSKGRIRETVAAYDLESLIGWLGNRMDELVRISPKNNPYPSDKVFWEATCHNYPNSAEGFGATPLEAVYKLAEAIHGKEAS